MRIQLAENGYICWKDTPWNEDWDEDDLPFICLDKDSVVEWVKETLPEV